MVGGAKLGVTVGLKIIGKIEPRAGVALVLGLLLFSAQNFYYTSDPIRARENIPIRPVCDNATSTICSRENCANETHRLRVGERSETVVVLLTGCVPESEVDGLAVDHDVGRVVVEHGWDVLPGKGVCGVADQEACLT